MLDDQLKTQLAAYLERVQQPFELVASLDDSETAARHARAARDHPVPAQRQDHPAHRWQRRPQALVQPAAPWAPTNSLRFAGLPLGHEFTSLVLALLWTGGHPPKVEPDLIDQIKALDGDFNFEVYMTPDLPQLPGRGAGAVADGHPEPQASRPR